MDTRTRRTDLVVRNMAVNPANGTWVRERELEHVVQGTGGRDTGGWEGGCGMWLTTRFCQRRGWVGWGGARQQEGICLKEGVKVWGLVVCPVLVGVSEGWQEWVGPMG